MKKFTFLFIILSCTLFGQTIQNGFNFYMPPYDSTSQKFLPYFPMVPIGPNDFVSVNDGHFSINGNRARFWSINVTDAAVFPEKDKAAGVAGQLRKNGFNHVRFHYFDQGNNDFSIFTKGQSTRQINPTNQDKMEKLLSELKKNGVYVDMNLNVARQFNELDGVPDADSLIEFGKGVTLFDPQLITLQKEYARSLLTHVNPYTGLALVNDPVMAMVEITNENWFFLYWQSDRLKPFTQGGMLTQRHNRMLEEQWNDYLIEKYGTTQNLMDAWNTDSPELIANGGFEDSNILDNWALSLNDPSAQAALTKETNNTNSGNGSAKVNIQNSGGTNWFIQFSQFGLSFENGKEYTLEFSAKSSNSETISVMMGKQTSPYSSYSYHEATLTNQWKKYSFTFTLNNTLPGDVKLAFQLGENSGQFWFDDVSIKLKSGSALNAGEILENKSVHRMYRSEINSYMPKRVRDLYEFFVTLQTNYYKDMYSFLKNELGVKVPISGSNYPMGVADSRIQSELDYIDVHHYWDLDWDGNSFFNNSMINNPATSTIANLGFQGVEGKPLTISEYNHPWPNNYQVEAPFFLAGYGSYNDVDAVMLFAMSEADAWTIDRTLSPFNCGRNGVLMATMPSFGYAYRNGLISSAQNTTTINYSDNDMYDLFEQGWLMYPENINKNIALTHKIRSRLNSATNFDASALPAAPANPYTSDTGQLIWDENGLLKINTEKFIGFVGFLNQFKNAEIGKIKILDADKFAGVTWLSLDNLPLEKSTRSLLTIGTRQQNSNMVWSNDNKKVLNIGTAPTVIEPTKLSLRFNIEADSIRVCKLGVKGETTISANTYYPINENQFVVSIDQYTDHSLWYGIETNWTNESIRMISLLQPTGGEQIVTGTGYKIKWVQVSAGRISIWFSTDAGADWSLITGNVDASLNEYNWPVPDVESSNCMIKIVAEEDNSVNDISGSVFSTYTVLQDNLLKNGNFSLGFDNWNFYTNMSTQGSASVVDRILNVNIINGGTESWHVQLIQPTIKIEKGKTYDIQFDASANQTRNINVGVGQDGGSYASYFSQSVSLSTEMKTYKYSFIMNNNTDNNSRFAMDLGNSNVGLKLDNIILSEHKVEKLLSITSPSSSDVWIVNKSYNINWTSNDINKINIYYKLASQSSWAAIASNLTAGTGQYSWTIPLLSSDSCQIKLEDTEDNSVNVISSKFYIKTPTLAITSPVENDVMIVNKNYIINWISENVNKVNIYYKTLSATTWIKFGNNITASINKYSWTVPVIPADSCQVKIENAEIITINSISPKFYIMVPTVEVISPKEGDVLQPGGNYQVEWKSQFIDTLNIFYKLWNASTWTKIGDGIDATVQKYSWTIPNTANDSCQIKIEDYRETGVNTISSKFYIKSLSAVNGTIIPTEYSLSQNFPNPFNPVSRIRYQVPKQSHIQIALYDIIGNEVMVLVNELRDSGYYEIELNGSNLTSGIYFLKMNGDGFNSIKKIILMK
jgi:hypothetical protein